MIKKKTAPNQGVSLVGAVVTLEKMIVHIINKDLLQNQKAFAVAHHCMRSLLESMVDLKDTGSESSESDSSGLSSESDSGSSVEDDDSMNVRFPVQLTPSLVLFAILALHVPYRSPWNSRHSFLPNSCRCKVTTPN